ncbi:hypothetical protein [Streptomyces mirabilis]|uniref:hypothetical protein n=1 Tax=Streptomyces mirabilis TaxID=68239 RepID=UPI002255DFB6|nr:hypothetical protein [Streptomyces mirabilis]MCX4612101.1 hypothetical protein [Streptomyces mirabilis]
MTDLLAPLSDEQDFLLITMSGPYVASGKWPTWHFVRQTLDREGLDADKLIQSLPRVGRPPGQGMSYGLAWSNRPHFISDDQQPGLTIAAALHIPDLIPAMAQPFLNVLRALVEIHRAVPLSPDKVVQATFNPEMIRRALPSISDLFMARLIAIMDHEPATWGGSRWGSDEEWTRELGREISRYGGLTDLKSYVARVVELMPEPVESVNGPVQAESFRFSSPLVIRDLPRSVTGFNSVPEVAPAPEPQAPPAPPPPVYVDESLIKELEETNATTQWDVTKLVQLLRELNSNFAAENPYSCLALLRAILDHVPPVLNAPDFNQAASNYKWGQTDKATDRVYAVKLRDARALGDDALHRQIRRKPDLISMDDVPSRRYLNAILRHVIDAL